MKTSNPFDLYHLDITEAKVKHSQSWYNEKIKSMDPRKISQSSIMKHGSKLTATLIPGRMYAYHYMPKNATTLPFYDTFPLIFPFMTNDTTFHGLNMHYLDYQMRFSLFRELLKISNVTTLNETTKMKVKWELLQGVKSLAPAQACVKQYRYDHVKSPFLEIESKDWATALLMPIANFAKSSQSSVWQSSKQLSRNW